MVVVVWMKSGFEDPLVFRKFLSAFPCLAVPYDDYVTRYSICSTIGLDWSYYTLLVDPHGTILQNNDASHFLSCGSEWFPFRDSDYERIYDQSLVLRIRLGDPFCKESYLRHPSPSFPDSVWWHPLIGTPLSLSKDILLCDPSFQLKRVGPDGGSVRVSELNNKYVGLYMCLCGDFMSKLKAAHQRCIEINEQLEIVLICLPMFEDLVRYETDLHEALAHYNITSWLLFPFDNKVSRRIWRSLGQLNFLDKFVILPPNSKPGELLGREVITKFGLDQYPFTRSSVQERRLATLKSISLISWFRSTTMGRTSLRGLDLVETESRLYGKRVLLYRDWLCCMEGDSKLFSLLMGNYQEIQRQGCEVLFFPLDVDVDTSTQPDFSKMPWPCMPCSVDKSVASQLIFETEFFMPHIIVFERDGKILSRKNEIQLLEYGFGEHLFKDMLYNEITAELASLTDCSQ